MLNLYQKYKAFETRQKEKSFWRFLPLYLVKTALKYFIVVLFAMGSYAIATFIIDIVELQYDTIYYNYWDNIIILLTFLSWLFYFVGTSWLYTLFFSLNRVTLHPYICLLFPFLLYHSQKDVDSDAFFIFLGTAFLLVVISTILQIVILCLLKSKLKLKSIF
jgi:hypothetical protein